MWYKLISLVEFHQMKNCSLCFAAVELSQNDMVKSSHHCGCGQNWRIIGKVRNYRTGRATVIKSAVFASTGTVYFQDFKN